MSDYLDTCHDFPDPDDDDDVFDLTDPATIVSDTMVLQAEAMMEEGYTAGQVVMGMTQAVAELQWEIYEGRLQ